MSMKNIAGKLSVTEYEKNFAEINPPLTELGAKAEASRCLYCYDAPCTYACPTIIDVPGFIKKIKTTNYTGSAKTILDANILGLSCARVCTVEELCEGACVMNKKGEPPIQIGKLQRFATEWAESGNINFFSAGKTNSSKVAVVGAGPAGLACSAELAKLGYSVTIYEADAEPGGLNAFGIASYKIRKQDISREIKNITDIGVKIITESGIGKDKNFSELLEEYCAVFVGTGLGKTFKLDIPGGNLAGVYDALSFIRQTKTRPFNTIDVGKRIGVIGGGNTAIDAATAAKRLGAEQVFIIYRRSREQMPAFPYEYRLAKMDGIVFLWTTSPIELVGADAVEGIRCVRMKLENVDFSGRSRPVPIEGSEFLLKIDMVIEAIGQKSDLDFLSTISGLELNKGLIKVNEKNGQTSLPNVFAGGDCVNGAKEVVHAVQEGKRAASGIHEYLSGAARD